MGVAPTVNFEEPINSFATLFELMVSGNFETMYTVIAVTGTASVFYFATFTILVNVLFANLFFGLILSKVHELVS